MLDLTIAQLSQLFRKAKIKPSSESLIRVFAEREEVFHGCGTLEDAVQRLKDLSAIVPFS